METPQRKIKIKVKSARYALPKAIRMQSSITFC
jgi:hypothetical protein